MSTDAPEPQPTDDLIDYEAVLIARREALDLDNPDPQVRRLAAATLRQALHEMELTDPGMYDYCPRLTRENGRLSNRYADIDRPHSECLDCDEQFATPEASREHLSATARTLDTEHGPKTGSHRTQVVNPTDEEIRRDEVATEIDRAVEDALERLGRAVRRGDSTHGEIAEGLRHWGLEDAWREYWLRDAIDAGVLGPVPEDDEGTVRVPTKAPDDALNALARLSHEVIASTQRTGASTEAALADVRAVEDALRAPNERAS